MTENDYFDEADLESFCQHHRGDVLLPGDDGYGDARAVWNGMIDKYPSIVARCAGTADVMLAVDFAREHDLPLSVKAGGHNVSGKAVCDEGLTIDLSGMDAVRVDPETKTARVQPGATWADFDSEAQAFGLATPGGVDSRTGIAGLTLGGGVGWLSRRFGLTCDNLLAADVVTADGDLVHASETENADLFWGLRGGGGNFGVVTSFEFRLHEVGPEVLTAQAFHRMADAREVLAFYREFASELPPEATCYALIVHVPPEEPFPEEYHLEPAVALVAVHSGSPDDGRAALEPISSFGEPIFEAVMPIPYAALQQSFDDGTPDGERYYYKSQYVANLSEGAIETIVDRAASLPGPFTIVGIEQLGGAIGAVEPTATAFPHRDAAFNVGIWAGWSEPANDDEMVAWAREFDGAIAPYSTGGTYANYLDRDDDDRTASAFGENYSRLAAVKAEWDPENLFANAPPVEPAGGPE